MILDNSRIYDGIVSFAGGQDSGRNPVLISEDQYQEGENVVCRGGKLTTRPSYRELSLNFTNNIEYDEDGGHGGANPIGTEDAFTNGLFQCAHFYDPSLEVDMLVVSIGGRLFSVVPRRTSADVTELYLDKQNRNNIPKSWMVQADRFHVTQDGENTPIIYDGVTARRANADEIFTGTIMAYGLGRIVLIGKNFRDIYFGDLYGSHEGIEPGLSVLKFTETTFLSEGGAASLPFTMGHAKGAIFFPEQDTTMGQGELLVFAEKGMASFFLDLPREQWKTSKFQAMGLIDIGATGDRTLTPINSDVWFRSFDGWRTYRQARSEAKGWFQLPLSTEVGNYTDVETPQLMEFGSSIHFNNRLLCTTTPIPNTGRPYHNGMLSLDFDVLSSFGQARKPAWDGHWSGIKVTQLVEGTFNGEKRAFAFGLNDDNENVLYEITESYTKDSSGPISSHVIPRSFTFNQYFNEYTVLRGDIWWEDVRENTTTEAYFKPDAYPEWLPWRTGGKYPMTTLKPIGTVGAISNGLPTLRKGFSPAIQSLTKPDVPTDITNTKRDLKRGFEIHTKIAWTGHAAINRFRLANTQEIEKSKATP